jgi:hypothetical protein
LVSIHYFSHFGIDLGRLVGLCADHGVSHQRQTDQPEARVLRLEQLTTRSRGARAHAAEPRD